MLLHDENLNNEVYLPLRVCGEWVLIVWDVEARGCYGVSFDVWAYSQIMPIVETLCSVGKETILESGLKCKESVIKEKQVNWQIQKGPVNYHR